MEKCKPMRQDPLLGRSGVLTEDEPQAYSFAEECANYLTHGFGAMLSVVGLSVLLLHTATTQDTWKILSMSIYGGSLVLLYLASTFYHASRRPGLRAVLKTFDHCAIYLLIAGSYTPFLLVTMREGSGWTLFALVWGIALLGIVLKIAYGHRFHKLRVSTYLLMGWLVVAAGDELLDKLATGGIVLLVAGGLVYSLGVVFYLGNRIPYNHAIWHVFVMVGSLLHFFAVLFYVVPGTPPMG